LSIYKKEFQADDAVKAPQAPIASGGMVAHPVYFSHQVDKIFAWQSSECFLDACKYARSESVFEIKEVRYHADANPIIFSLKFIGILSELFELLPP
jgi:hypothetical protein